MKSIQALQLEMTGTEQLNEAGILFLIYEINL